jgi:hypothetical protein
MAMFDSRDLLMVKKPPTNWIFSFLGEFIKIWLTNSLLQWNVERTCTHWMERAAKGDLLKWLFVELVASCMIVAIQSSTKHTTKFEIQEIE